MVASPNTVSGFQKVQKKKVPFSYLYYVMFSRFTGPYNSPPLPCFLNYYILQLHFVYTHTCKMNFFLIKICKMAYAPCAPSYVTDNTMYNLFKNQIPITRKLQYGMQGGGKFKIQALICINILILYFVVTHISCQ